MVLHHGGGECDGTCLTVLTVSGTAGTHTVPVEWRGTGSCMTPVPLATTTARAKDQRAVMADDMPRAAVLMIGRGMRLIWWREGAEDPDNPGANERSLDDVGEDVKQVGRDALEDDMTEDELNGWVRWHVPQFGDGGWIRIHEPAHPLGVPQGVERAEYVLATGDNSTAAIALGGARAGGGREARAAGDGREDQ